MTGVGERSGRRGQSGHEGPCILCPGFEYYRVGNGKALKSVSKGQA